MEEMTEAGVAIATMIIGGALLALIVSKQSQTPQVISALANGFSTMLKTALSPVVQNGVNSPISLNQ
jgi:PRD1 phage membrane DNA delivery